MVRPSCAHDEDLFILVNAQLVCEHCGPKVIPAQSSPPTADKMLALLDDRLAAAIKHKRVKDAEAFRWALGTIGEFMNRGLPSTPKLKLVK